MGVSLWKTIRLCSEDKFGVVLPFFLPLEIHECGQASAAILSVHPSCAASFLHSSCHLPIQATTISYRDHCNGLPSHSWPLPSILHIGARAVLYVCTSGHIISLSKLLPRDTTKKTEDELENPSAKWISNKRLVSGICIKPWRFKKEEEN